MNPQPFPARTVAIIPAAGMGRRMGSIKKSYIELLGVPVLARTLEPFEACPLVDSVIIVVQPSDEELCRAQIVERFGFRKVAAIVAGGAERQDSVSNGLRAAGPGARVVLVHDGARPLVTVDLIERCAKAAAEHGAAIAAVPVKDTIKEASGGLVLATLPRHSLQSVQTPQAFACGLLEEAFAKAREDGFVGTDESSLVERTGHPVRVVEGSYENIKITTPEDMALAECILRSRG